MERKLTPREYFNTGVLVFSRQNYPLIEDLKDHIIFGHPQFEQGFLNVRRVVREIPFFPSPPDLNYIPDWRFPVDWRYGFFIHFAGTGKPKYNYAELWEDKTGARDTFSKRTFMSADIRTVLLRIVADQMSGRDVKYFDSTDFLYLAPHAFPDVLRFWVATCPPTLGATKRVLRCMAATPIFQRGNGGVNLSRERIAASTISTDCMM